MSINGDAMTSNINPHTRSMILLMIMSSPVSPWFLDNRIGVSNKCIGSAPSMIISESFGTTYDLMECSKQYFTSSFLI